MVDQGRIVPTPLPFDIWHRLDDRLEVQLWKVPHRDEFADTVGFVFRGPSASLLFLPDINSWSAWDREVAEAVYEIVRGQGWPLRELRRDDKTMEQVFRELTESPEVAA